MPFSESDNEAANSHSAMSALVEQMFNSNEELRRRFDALEASLLLRSSAGSVITTREENSADTITPSEDKDTPQDTIPLEASIYRFAFEDILQTSRVYWKSSSNECDISIRSSFARSHAWSAFSDLSLVEISVLSVFALPICAADLSNSQWYINQRGSRQDTREKFTSPSKQVSNPQMAAIFNDLNTIPPLGLYVRALYDYDADDRTELSFKQGDTIQVIAPLESGWWDGIINDVRGWFPSNYCTVVPSPSDSVRVDLETMER